LQSEPRDRARRAGGDCRFEPQVIYDAASEYFHVKRLKPWSRRPIWLLDAK
jgi:hypothetical protein